MKIGTIKKKMFLSQHRQGSMLQNQNHAIDLMKYICAVFVILLHASTILSFSPAFRFIIVNVFGRVAVPFFFLTGAYFLAKNMQKKDHFYLKIYLYSLCKSYIFWSIAYLPLGIIWIQDNLQLAWYLYPFALLIAVLYVGMYYPLWYLPAFMTAVLIVYWWTKYFRLQWLFLISCILLCFGALETYYGVLPNGPLLDFFNFYIKYFITTRNFLFFALFYVTCGFVLSQSKIFLHKRIAMMGSILFFVCMVIEAYFLISTETLNFNILLFAAPFTICIFSYLLQCDLKLHMRFHNLRLYSQYYYYVHGFVLFFVSCSIQMHHGHGYATWYYLLFILLLTHYVSVLCHEIYNRRAIYMYHIHKMKRDLIEVPIAHILHLIKGF